MAKQRVPFKRVFDLAQNQLRVVFGMEMVELPGREKVTLKEMRGKPCLKATRRKCSFSQLHKRQKVSRSQAHLGS